jgi:hypothetical protein
VEHASHEELETSPSASTNTPTPAPEPAQAPAAAKAPPTAAQAPARAEHPAEEPSEDEVHYERTASGEIKSGMPLERIPDEALDPNNMQPPATSGPLAELEKEFEGSARDASSSSLEATVESAFRGPNVPKELFDSVVCHGSVCRAHTRWTRERAGGFMLAMMTLTAKAPDQPGGPPPFSTNFAIGKAAERNTNGERELDVYFRKQ